MKLSSLSFASALTCLVAAVPAPVPEAQPIDFNSLQNAFGIQPLANHDIPGDSPVALCDVEDNHLLRIDSVDIFPNPPVRGENLTINAVGFLAKEIKEGAYVDVEVKFGYIRLLRQQFDLCEQVENIDMKCPLEPGPLSINKTVELPSQIPPGKYNVVARAYTVDDDQITCLLASVEFPTIL
ncbi:hypothetical protein NADFUDRAFT_83053 [Nadsonia fulvescens var. elongata DSM 6958]|uniref:Phosphatidylglycerol/phosphatidylinositol transfer protein n=1 Tax=Nadsonia fulvescens var. elongata DSM 6958 TaxID=857566 RepID=A0A1E3PHQ1_9ASCO|nr:hypothetical protein NADFUDRAFT_83053 [Nadsonia fulvescens var. elongata DSM 6958]